VNCRPERDGRFFIGCSFVRAAAEARRTASLLKRAAAGPDATAGGASAAA
jgi:hypothetical protein